MGTEEDHHPTKYERVMAGERPPRKLVEFERELLQKLREEERGTNPQDENNTDKKKTST